MMVNLSTLSSEQRVEAYRSQALAALEKARATDGRDAALYLNLATQWIRLADVIAERVKGERRV